MLVFGMGLGSGGSLTEEGRRRLRSRRSESSAELVAAACLSAAAFCAADTPGAFVEGGLGRKLWRDREIGGDSGVGFGFGGLG